MKYLKSFNEQLSNKIDLTNRLDHGGDNIYAIVIHRLTKLPIYTLQGYFKEEDWDEELGYTSYDHHNLYSFVKLKNGKYLDNTGIIDIESIKKWMNLYNEYDYFKIVKMTELECANIHKGSDEQDIIDEATENKISELIKTLSKKINYYVAKGINKL